jgi:hypothetical protein
MSDKILKKITETLDCLVAQQEQIVARLDHIERDLRSPGGAAGRASQSEAIAFLDGFRANEALGEASLGAWIAVCEEPCLKGGLRTVQCREGMHARLLEERLKELGGSPTFEVPEAVYESAMKGAASTDASDAKKLLDFTAQFPDIDAALAPIAEMADRLDDDPETQSLLRTIMQDERSTLVFLRDACAQLNG